MHVHHEHDHSKEGNKKGLWMALIITTIILLVELIGGWLTNSLALLSDAGHMFSDAGSLFLSLLAFILASRRLTNHRKSYGYHRFEIIAAFINGIALWIVAIFILLEAYERLMTPPEVNGQGMLFVAIIGLLCNLLSAWVLVRKGDVHDNLNMRSAYLHVVSDALGSIGAIIAAFAIQFFSWFWADAVVSLLISVFIFRSGWHVVSQSTHILMEGTPEAVDLSKVKQMLEAIPGVLDVHDLHVWTITSGMDSLSCHLLIQDHVDGQEILRHALNQIEKEFQIEHATIQIETEDFEHKGCNC